LTRACCRDAFVADYQHTRAEHFEMLLRHHYEFHSCPNGVDYFRQDPTKSLGDELKELRRGFRAVEGKLSWFRRSPISSAELSAHATETTIASVAYISSGEIAWINRPGMSAKLNREAWIEFRNTVRSADKANLSFTNSGMPDWPRTERSLDYLSEKRSVSDVDSEGSMLAITSNGSILEAWDDAKMGDLVYRFSGTEAIVVRADGPKRTLVGRARSLSYTFPKREDFNTPEIKSCQGSLYLGYSALRVFCTPGFWPYIV
jgi:hypothetical protein